MAEIDKFTEKIKYLKCRSFFPDYCGIRYTSGILRKLSGKNANGNPGKFTDEQKKTIIEGLEKYISEIKTLIML
jgi:hypothetical protein